MVGKGNKNVLLIQKDASSFAEFEISSVDCTSKCLHYELENCLVGIKRAEEKGRLTLTYA